MATSSNVTRLEIFQEDQNYIEENYLEPDVTSEIIFQSGKNMYVYNFKYVQLITVVLSFIDEIECLMLTKIIRTFSAKRQIITKMKIAELIMQQELLKLEETSTDNTL